MARRDLPILVTTPVIPQNYSALPDPYAHPGISLAQLFSIVWAWRKLTMLIALSCMLLAFAVSKLLPKTYQATATLMVDYEVNDPLGGKEFPVGLMGSYMSTQTQLIRSPAVLLPVIERLKLTEDEDFISGFSGDPLRKTEYVKNRLIKQLVVEQGTWGSQMIYVTASTGTAQSAALIANTVSDVYAEQQFLRLTGPATQRGERYTEQLNELKKQVDVAQEQLTAFRQRTKLVDSGEKIDLELERLTNLEQRLAEASQQRREIEAKSLGGTAVRDAVLNSGSVQTLKSQLAGINARLAELSATLGPRHPQVMELKSQQAITQSALNAELGAYSGNASASIAGARSVEQQLQQAVVEARERVLKKRLLDDEAAKYTMALESAQTLYKRALEGYDQIILTKGGGYNNVSFVARATPPVKAAKPKVMLNTLLGLILGMFFGIAGPLGYELFNRRVRHRDDLDRDFGLPVLAEFNRLPMPSGAQ